MHTLKLILYCSTVGFYNSTFWVGSYQHGTSSLQNLSKSDRASPVHSPLQITPQMFDRIQVWTLAGTFQSLNLIPVKPFFC